ncbi:para-nitrobenzyl esterase [Cordyceps militaris CM01]|uniref:Carboxylic ester hydrolase n=1 Tax=Cordyceps militaris (strain CM01) TaxID=983644 RepID=G3JFI2_CORMM|nr:para-nitrobenzyl esterase [Cordyceps militaris CM01]EGX93556.1 para-nitrobenzyl esterase [Cordyceps militaris CM01]
MLSMVEIQLRDGAICALKHGDIIRARGVRYAQAARFQAPQSVQPWTGIADCTRPASICPQLPSRLEDLNGNITAGHAMDEDCLHVSICAPWREDMTALLPVVVFIHGGGYTSGGGDLDVYSGVELAAAGVVHVSITYRLGILGYQPVEGVAPANLGLLDQMAALRWIRDNISSFGGDAEKLTLSGSSAGGDSIYCLFAADGAEGLFQRAILMSTPLGVRHMDRRSMDTALERTAKASLGQNPADMPLEELFEVQKKLAIEARGFTALGLPFAPMLGHAPLPSSKAEFDARVQRALERIPIFVGYCRDEGVAFQGLFGGMSPDLQPALTTSVVDFISKSWFQDDSDKLWEQARAAGGNPWFYELVAAPDGSPFGATHTLEVPFLLGGWDAWKNAPMLEGGNAQELVNNVGAAVKRLWVAFACCEDVGQSRFTIDERFQGWMGVSERNAVPSPV